MNTNNTENTDNRIVFCKYLNKELEGLSRMPYPGELGKKIYDNISKQAWQLWLEHQTMLINENHLSLASNEARTFLVSEMEKFLFEGDANKPAGFIPEK